MSTINPFDGMPFASVERCRNTSPPSGSISTPRAVGVARQGANANGYVTVTGPGGRGYGNPNVRTTAATQASTVGFAIVELCTSDATTSPGAPMVNFTMMRPVRVGFAASACS